MRSISVLHPTDRFPLPPDTMANYMISGTPQAADWPASASLVRFRAASTNSGILSFVVNMISTAAVWPAATVTATTNSSGLNVLVPGASELLYQIPAGSTGFSFAAGSSGIMSIEFWKK